MDDVKALSFHERPSSILIKSSLGCAPGPVSSWHQRPVGVVGSDLGGSPGAVHISPT